MNWRRYPWIAALRTRWIRRKFGTTVECTGEGHSVEMSHASLYKVRIEISGRGNHLVIGANTRIWGGTIQLRGENLRCTVEHDCRLRYAVLVVEDRGSRLIVRKSTSGTGCTLLSCEGGQVEIGEDCMMSAGSGIRNSDGHSVIDEASGARTNPARDVKIGDHVWIGLGVQVLKGVQMGTQSIAAAGSVVVKDVEPHTLVAGIPARPIRSGISWVRERIEWVDTANGTRPEQPLLHENPVP
jgi:acetyltransferase-like isoleucine patch superfamily enzyme